MATLDRGIRINSDSTQVLLNNQLFETPQGALLFTTRIAPPSPLPAVGSTQEEVLLDGGSGGYIKVSVIYGPTSFQFKVAANPTSGTGPSSVSPPVPYNQEVTLGAVYDATTGLLTSRTSADAQVFGSPPNPPWVTTGGDEDAGVDPPIAIGLPEFNGFIGKLATYSKAFSTSGIPSELDSFVANPNLWPSTDRLHLLDGTQILGASWVNVARPETQTLTFGNAAATGLITVGGIEVLVQQGDSGAVVAEKVQAKLIADNLYKVQAEKQNLTFEPLSGSATTPGSIVVDGVTVTLTNVNSEAAIATNVADALKAAYASASSTADKKARIVQKNADESVTITFAASEGNANLVPVNSGTSGVAVSVDTVVPYSASALGRTVTRDGNKLSITFNRYDENIENFATNAPYPKFLVSPGSTGVTVSSQESIAHIPSEFIFKALPQGKVQKILITSASDEPASGTPALPIVREILTTEGNALHVVIPAGAGSDKAALATAVAKAINVSRLNTDSTEKLNLKIAGAQVDPTDNASVLVRFTPEATEKAHVLVFKGSGSPSEATVQTVSAFAQGARGEIQQVSFNAGNTAFQIDGVAVTPPTPTAPATTATAKQVADAAKLALEKKDVMAEVKVLQFTNTSATTAAGEIVIAGIPIPVTSGQTKENLASGVAAFFGVTNNSTNLAKSPFSSVTASGDKVTFTYKATVAHPSDQSLLNTGLFLLPTGAEATVVATDPAARPYNAGYATSAIQTITFKSLDPGLVALQFDVDDPASTSTPPSKLTHTFTLAGPGPFTASTIAAQAAGSLQADIVAASPTQLGKVLSAVVPDGDSVHFVFKNSIAPTATKSIPTISVKGGAANPQLTFTGILGFSQDSPAPTLTQVQTDTFWSTWKYDALTTRFYDAAGRHKLSVSDAGVLTIEFSPSEGDVDPVLVNTTGSTVTAAVSTLQPAHLSILSTAGYDGGGGGSAANVLYAQLKEADPTRSTANALLDEREVTVDVFVDRSKAVTATSDFGAGFESVSFMLSYDPALMKDADPVVKIPASTSGSAVFNVNRQAGEITIRVVDNASVSDFSKAVASVEFVQRKTGADFAPRMNVEFKNVDIDGINFTGGSFNSSFVSGVNLDRWDVASKLVNALQPSTGIGGQLVAFYGSPTMVSGQPVSLKLAPTNGLTDVGGGAPTLAAATKTVSLDLVTNVAGTAQASMVLTLPSNLTAASFTPATGVTATSSLNGRLLEVTVTNAGNMAASGKLGTVSVSVKDAESVTHEFGFLGSVTVNNQANAAGGQPVYVGYIRTDANGNWSAKDMPKGDLNKLAVPTAATNAAKVVTAADALEILKLSAGFVPTWIGSDGDLLSAAYVAADVDRSGNVTAQDALLALRHAAATLGNDPMTWRFIDASTRGLGVNNASPSSLNQGLQVSGNERTVSIDGGSNPDFQVKALLVGNLTLPVAGEYVV